MHRDLKPPNVLYKFSEKAELILKIADLGLATTRKSSVNTIVSGTNGYNAPEQGAFGNG